MEIKCKHCNREFTEEPNAYPGKVYTHFGEAICEDCLIGMGVLPDHADSEHTRLMTEHEMFIRRM